MSAVVVDLGGTNIRFSVCDLETGKLSQLSEYVCTNFVSVEQALLAYFSTLNSAVNTLCIGIACPVENDQVTMTNLSWSFSQKALKEQLNLSTLHVINDYTAISLAVPFLAASDKFQIGAGIAQEDANTAVFGPGTGLGVSHIIKVADKWISLEGEAGHVSFTANTRQQADILFQLQTKFGHVSAEQVMSGQGLVNLYQSLCNLSQKAPLFIEPKQITQAALNNECVIARQTLDIFCQIMGSFAGNLAMSLNCTGGVYIAGGIVPRFLDFFEASQFRQYFEEKGRLKDYLTKIPTFVITHKNPGLLGAATYLRQELKYIH